MNPIIVLQKTVRRCGRVLVWDGLELLLVEFLFLVKRLHVGCCGARKFIDSGVSFAQKKNKTMLLDGSVRVPGSSVAKQIPR